MKRFRRSLAARSLAASVVAASCLLATPAGAQPTHPCYLHTPITAEHLFYCACVDIATELSPVIPPETWNCNL